MSLTDKESFDVAREIIRHEDGLVNNRVTWLLVLQGFLIAAFVGGVGLFEKLHNGTAAALLTIGLLVIGRLGILASQTVKNSIDAALASGDEAKKWFRKQPCAGEFPEIAGSKPTYTMTTGKLTEEFETTWKILMSLLAVGVLVRLAINIR